MTAQNPRRTDIVVPPAAQHLSDKIVQGCVALTHNGMAMLGTGLALSAALLLTQPELRHNAEQQLLGWLQQRQAVATSITPSTSAPNNVKTDSSASEPNERTHTTTAGKLPRSQEQVAHWLSRKYRVAPEPLSTLVAEAFYLGQRIRIEPTLILAVMAIESRFNPYAQSPVGAQGLMQVMTRVHTDKYDDFGGHLAAFDPLSNLHVGVQVLQECIARAGGSIEGGLKLYVGAVSTDGSDYVDKVMTEHKRLRQVAMGKRVPVNPAA